MHNKIRVKHILDIDIPAWQNGSGDWFTVKLLALIAKADPINRERIRNGFPSEVEAFERWERWSDDRGWTLNDLIERDKREQETHEHEPRHHKGSGSGVTASEGL